MKDGQLTVKIVWILIQVNKWRQLCMINTSISGKVQVFLALKSSDIPSKALWPCLEYIPKVGSYNFLIEKLCVLTVVFTEYHFCDSSFHSNRPNIYNGWYLLFIWMWFNEQFGYLKFCCAAWTCRVHSPIIPLSTLSPTLHSSFLPSCIETNIYLIYISFTACHPSCSACLGPGISECLSCQPNYVLQGHRCLSNCSVGNYQSRSECLCK